MKKTALITTQFQLFKCNPRLKSLNSLVLIEFNIAVKKRMRSSEKSEESMPVWNTLSKIQDNPNGEVKNRAVIVSLTSTLSTYYFT